MSNNLNLSLTLRAVDHLTAPLRRINSQIETLQAPVRNLGSTLNRSLQLTGLTQIKAGLAGIGREVGALTFKLTAMGLASGYAFKHMFIDTAAEFEGYKITLETFYGTSQKAQGALDWVSSFAASTPYQLGEVTKGFIELKSFGLDPIQGSLKAAGDAAAAMGKPLEMATNTLASALRGQADMLDNFGIFGRIEKDMMVFDWVDNAGKKFHKEVNKTNRDQIAKTITGIWQQKFGGSMDRLSQGFTGIVSNIQDNITRLSVKVMEGGGSFSFLKDELQKVLDTLNYLQTPEGLKETEQWGVKLRKVLGDIKAFAGEAWGKINQMADAVGGFGNLAKLLFGGIAAIMAGPLLMAITSTIGALVTLTTVLLANPLVLAIGLMAAAVFLLHKNWDAVVAGIKDGIIFLKDLLVNGLMSAIDGVTGGIKLALAAIVDGVSSVARAIANVAQFKNPFAGGEAMFPMPTEPQANSQAPGRSAAKAPIIPIDPMLSIDLGKPASPITTGKPANPVMMGKPVDPVAMGKPVAPIVMAAPVAPLARRAPDKVDVGGLLHIKIDSPTPVKVASMKSNDPRQTINVDAGPTMAGTR